MASSAGTVCTGCGIRRTAPCDGEDPKCPYNKTIKPKIVKRKNLFWIPVLFVLGLLACGCEPDYYVGDIAPIYRDTGYIIVDNSIAIGIDNDTMGVERTIDGETTTYFEVSCQGVERKRILLPITAPVLSFKRDDSAYIEFEKCPK